MVSLSAMREPSIAGAWRHRGIALAVALASICLPAGVVRAQSPGARTTASVPGGSGLPVPRFVSLKSDRVNLRQGPGTEYRIAWVFRRAGLPVEVVQEFEAWRQVRDSEGTTGWVLSSMLSGRRTALVLPWEMKADAGPPAPIPLRSDDRNNAAPVALVEPGVLASVLSCDSRWCRLAIGSHKGYLEQNKLWGVYEGEVIR